MLNSAYPFAGSQLSPMARIGNKNHLPVMAGGRYIRSVAAKSVTGRRNPENITATPDAFSVFFCVATSTHLRSTAHSRTVSMVALAGQLSGWPVPVVSGIPTPVNVTTPLECRNSGGDSDLNTTEAIAMATTPARIPSKYQYRFMALSRADHSAKPLRLSIEATSEREARKTLAPHYILSLAAVLPVQEVRHA